MNSTARLLVCLVIATLVGSVGAFAQECQQDEEIAPAVHTALSSAASRVLSLSAQGDFASLKAMVAPVAEGSLSAIERSVQQNRTALSGTATVKHVYLLTMPADAPDKRGEFFCGVYDPRGHTANSAGFIIPNLAPGQYGVVFQQVTSASASVSLALVLQQVGQQWKIAGYYLKPAAINGRDGAWFAAQAQTAKQKGSNYLAWLYNYLAWDLQAPVNFVSTRVLDRLSADMQSLAPPDIPVAGPVNFNAGGKQFRLTQVFPMSDADRLTLIVKHQVPDISNSAQMTQDNIALIRATVAAHSELRENFVQVVARAVAPSGEDYGTVMAMKDIR
jgi:hypothetical protein